CFLGVLCLPPTIRGGEAARERVLRGQQTPRLEAAQLPPRCLRPRAVSTIRDSFMLLPFSNWTSPSEIASSQIDRCGQLRRQASASAELPGASTTQARNWCFNACTAFDMTGKIYSRRVE